MRHNFVRMGMDCVFCFWFKISLFTRLIEKIIKNLILLMDVFRYILVRGTPLGGIS
jgi:hypothetical protein